MGLFAPQTYFFSIYLEIEFNYFQIENVFMNIDNEHDSIFTRLAINQNWKTDK